MQSWKWVKTLLTRIRANDQSQRATTPPYLKNLSDFARKQSTRVKIEPIHAFGLRR